MESKLLEKEGILKSTDFESFDQSVKYNDEYYENYINNFKPTTKKKYLYRFIKRFFDFFVSLVALVVLFVPMIIIAIAIKIDSHGPAIFKQKRIGKGGKPFTCYKFRSMKESAPHECATSVLDNPEQHITRVGRFLRKTSLDELPQLVCVLFGKMSLFGYRPLILSEKNCNEMRARMGVFKMRPGISGYAQVHGRDGVYYKNKAILDAYYVKHASLWFDIKLMLKTVAIVLSRSGAR